MLSMLKCVTNVRDQLVQYIAPHVYVCIPLLINGLYKTVDGGFVRVFFTQILFDFFHFGQRFCGVAILVDCVRVRSLLD